MTLTSSTLYRRSERITLVQTGSSSDGYGEFEPRIDNRLVLQALTYPIAGPVRQLEPEGVYAREQRRFWLPLRDEPVVAAPARPGDLIAWRDRTYVVTQAQLWPEYYVVDAELQTQRPHWED